MPIGAQLPNEVEAVLVRHTQVAYQHVGTRLANRLNCPERAARRGDDGADSFQHHNKYPPAVGFVIYDQHAQAIETDQRKTVGRWNGRLEVTLVSLNCALRLFGFHSVSRGPDRKANGKRRPFAVTRANGFDRSAVRFHDVFDNGKTEPQPGEPASRTAVALAKAVKDV